MSSDVIGHTVSSDVIGHAVVASGRARAINLSLLLVIFAIALGTRMFQIGAEPLWLDEIITLHRAKLDMGALMTDSLANRHMPSYFLGLHFATMLNGAAATLRSPSAMCGAITAAVVYATTRRLGGTVAGFIAGLFMALSPEQVLFGREARPYALLAMLLSIALWGLLGLAAPSDSNSSLADTASKRRTYWAVYLLGTVCALDVSADALPWLIIANLSLALIRRRLRDHRQAFGRAWMLSNVVIITLCVPLYGMMAHSGDGQLLAKFDWVPATSAHGIWVAISSVYLMRAAEIVSVALLPTPVPLLALGMAALCGVGVWRLRGKVEAPILLLAFALLPMLLLATSIFKPILIPRYLLWSAAPFFVLAGLGFAALPRRLLPGLSAMLVLATAANLMPVYSAETKPRWDQAAASLSSTLQPGDTIFTADPNGPDMLIALQPAIGPRLEANAVVTNVLSLAIERWKQGGRVWAVHGRSGLGKRASLDDFVASVAVFGAPTLTLGVGQELTILLFPPAA